MKKIHMLIIILFALFTTAPAHATDSWVYFSVTGGNAGLYYTDVFSTDIKPYELSHDKGRQYKEYVEMSERVSVRTSDVYFGKSREDALHKLKYHIISYEKSGWSPKSIDWRP